jgi:exopolysaccharide production protein ExoZ
LGYPEHHSATFFAYSLTLLPTDGYPFYDLGWSLQHEIAFYILAALLVPRFGLLGLSTFLCAGTAIDHIFTLPWYFHQYAGYYPNFLAGIAAFAANRHLKSFGFWIPAVSGLGLLFIGNLSYAPGLFLLLVGFVNMRPSGSSVGVLLGDASYSIYLIHPLVFSFVYIGLQPPLPPIWSQEFLRFGSIAVVCILAIASWKWFESPMIRVGNWLIRRIADSEPADYAVKQKIANHP